MNNFLKEKIVWFIILLLGLSGCDNSKEYHNGLNRIYNKGKLYKEIYVYNGLYNGVYIQYSDSPTVEKTGTYQNNRRNGLWDTIITGNKKSQIYYVNDTPAKILGTKYRFKYSKAPDFDLAFLRPATWDISDSLIYGGSFQSAPPTEIYEGKIKPSCMLYPVKGTQTLVHSYTSYSLKNPSDRSHNLLKVISPNQIIMGYITYPDTLVCSSKVINTRKGRFCINITCRSSDYFYYRYIFNTVLNSFNPISDTEQ